jgi:hypothetical protein
MQPPSRKFDISWVPRRGASRGAAGQQAAGGPESAARPAVAGILDRLRAEPSSPQHVVDLARASGVDFQTALQAVLDLAARGEVEIRERDKIGGDHLVALASNSGRA